MKYSLFSKILRLTSDNGASGSDAGSGSGSSDTNTTGDNSNPEDLTGLKNALASQRSLAEAKDKELKQFKQAFEGIDPAVAKQAMERLEQIKNQQETWNQEKTKLTATLTEDHNRKLSAEKEVSRQWQTKHDSLLTNILAQKAYEAAGGLMGGSDNGTYFDAFFAAKGAALKLNEQSNKLEVIDASGAKIFSAKNNGEPMEASEYFASFATDPVFAHYFTPAKNSRGGGMPPGSGNNGKSGITKIIDRSDMDALSAPGAIEAMAKGEVVIR